MAAKPQEVCRFYLQGNCKFGNRCYNIHPPKNQQGYNMGRMQNPNGGRYNSSSSWGGWRGGQGNSGWGGGGGGNNSWKGGNGSGNWGGGNDTWKGGSGSGNWGSRGGGGGSSTNWKGGSGSDNWEGGDNNWKSGGNGNWKSKSNWDNNRGGGNSWHGNGNRQTWQPKGGINWSNWEFDADNWTSDKPMGRGDNVFFRNIAEDMDTNNDNEASADVAEMIKIDISLWLQRGIWPLSSYTPSPFVCQSLPGFDDFSQEEIRWEGQIAALQRNPQAYLDFISQLMERRKLLWQHYIQSTYEETVKLQTGSVGQQSSPGQPLFYTNPQEPHEQFGLISKDLFGAKDGDKSILTTLTHPTTSSQIINNSTHSIAPPTSTTVTTTTTNDNSSGLTQTDIEAFKMKEFVFGKIPEVPPPQALI